MVDLHTLDTLDTLRTLDPLDPLKALNQVPPRNDQSALNPADRCLCTTTARLLAAVAGVAGALGMGCMWVGAVALGCLAWRGPTPPASQGPMTVTVTLTLVLVCVVWVVLVLLERLLALRVHFDAGLFAELARSGPTAASLHALDEALHTLGLRRAKAACRPLLDRVRGAQRLARWHVAIVVLQMLGLSGLCAGLLLGWSPL